MALSCSTQRGTYEQDNATAATKGKLLQVAAGRFKTQQSQVFLGVEKGKGGETGKRGSRKRRLLGSERPGSAAHSHITQSGST